jgi:autotransporter-associated beta strand protein
VAQSVGGSFTGPGVYRIINDAVGAAPLGSGDLALGSVPALDAGLSPTLQFVPNQVNLVVVAASGGNFNHWDGANFSANGRVDGGGTLTLTANHTYTGNTTIGAGPIGRDQPLDKDWHVGAAFTYAAIDADLDAGGTHRNGACHFMGCGAYSRDDWEAAFWGGYTCYIVRSSRGTGLDATPTAQVEFDMHQLRLGGAVRRVLPIDANWTVLPKASLSYESAAMPTPKAAAAMRTSAPIHSAGTSSRAPSERRCATPGPTSRR